MVDASPDFKYQLDMISAEIRDTKRNGKVPVSGILLTHAHLGHCAGLWHLGKESVEEKDLPVFFTSKMKEFLCGNYQFSLFIQRKNIQIEEIYPDREFELNGLKCMPIQVPHRDEIGDTVGYILESRKTLVYLADLDKWTDDLMEEIRSSDIAFVDGTFYSRNEIPRFEEVPHLPIQETITLLEDSDTEIYFIHISHTSPANKEGREKKYIESRGFKIAHDGMTLKI